MEENVQRLIELKKKHPSKTPLVIAKIIYTIDTRNEIKPFTNKWKRIADFIEVGEYHTWDGTLKDTGKLNSGNQNANATRYPCTFLWYNPVILWDGRVTTCCVDYQGKGVIGDINKDSLSKIWQGKVLQNIRKAHLEGRYDSISLCNNCQFWKCEVNIGNWLKKVTPNLE